MNGVPMSDRRRVAWCGLGEMGAPMAGHLIAAGHDVKVWNRSVDKTEPLVAAGAAAARTPAEAGADAEAAVTMLWDPQAVEGVLFGADGVLSTLPAGATVIDCSTTTPEYSRSCARRLAERGFDYIEAPVSGRRDGAEQASLTVMVGGEQRVLDAVRSIIDPFAGHLVLVGPHGAGQAVKLAGNLIGIVGVAAIAEGLALSERCGANLDETLDALLGSTARSPMLEVFGPRIAGGDFAGGVTARLALKDMAAAAAAAADAAGSAPLAECATGLYERLVADGYGGEGFHAVARVLREPAV
jgi:3-hydroxyisobutyrate dehydrogenase-like beta-hydroxyacid dehydrogenase